MLERYFIRPTTVDRIRAAWLGEPIECSVRWLHEHAYAARNVLVRVPRLVRFGEFARDHGAMTFDQLPDYVDAFVAEWVHDHSRWCRSEADQRSVANAVRGPIEQLLQLMSPDYTERVHKRRWIPEPFIERAAGFFDYLREARGLRPATLEHYASVLRHFERYLNRIGLTELSELSSPMLSAFIAGSRARLGTRSLLDVASVLRIFLAFLYREGRIPTDLARTVEAPQRHRLVDLPRSISWADVHRVLNGVDRRSPVGKRDYAVLLLMVTYGLRAREVAALTLDSIDWKRDRLLVAERKAGHTTAYPLSTVVGEAIIDYLRNARPTTDLRALFFQVVAPYRPLNWWCVSQQTARHLRKAGIRVPRTGSHTLRHSCAQRLVDAEFPLKTIGDYLGHRSPDATAIYTEVPLRIILEISLTICI